MNKGKHIEINDAKLLNQDNFKQYCNENSLIRLKISGTELVYTGELNSIKTYDNFFEIDLIDAFNELELEKEISKKPTFLGTILHHNILIGIEFLVKSINNHKLIAEFPKKIMRLDTRSEPRYNISNMKTINPIIINITLPDYSLKPVNLKCFDLSFDGCSVIIPNNLLEEFPVNKELNNINFKLDNQLISITGIIRNNFKFDQNQMKIGIQFTKVNLLNKKILLQFFSKLLG